MGMLGRGVGLAGAAVIVISYGHDTARHGAIYRWLPPR